MRTCGIENFTIEVIERCQTQEQLNEREIFKILKGLYQDIQVDDYISIILIDNKRQTVADEFII